MADARRPEDHRAGIARHGKQFAVKWGRVGDIAKYSGGGGDGATRADRQYRRCADRGNGKQFAVKWGRVGPLLGLEGLGCAVHVVPPGKKAFPFHRHHVMDELFFIVSGNGEYRFGDETLPVRAGDIVGAPAGTEPHQIINTGSEDLRYLGISR